MFFKVLNELNRCGPTVLSNPSHIFSYCWMSGLFPKTGDRSKWQDRVVRSGTYHVLVSFELFQFNFVLTLVFFCSFCVRVCCRFCWITMSYRFLPNVWRLLHLPVCYSTNTDCQVLSNSVIYI